MSPFFPRVTPERYRRRLEQAVSANLNLIRVWGGGIYEDEAFYDICDELGLLTWQDFLFACAAYPEEAMKGLLDVLREHQVWLIVDEIYAELVYDGFEHVSAAKLAPDMLDRIVVVDGVSKTYAMTGWRIGWSIAPAKLAKVLDVVQGQSTTNATAVAQHAGLAALTGPQDELVEIRKRFDARRKAMVKGLAQIPGIECRLPEGAFYAFADCRGLLGKKHGDKVIATDEDLAFFFLEVAHCATVPGGAFGAPGYIRFSYALSEERIAEGLASITKAVASLV